MTRATLLLASFALAAFAAAPAIAAKVGLSAQACAGEHCPVETSATAAARPGDDRESKAARPDIKIGSFAVILRRSDSGTLEVTLADIVAAPKRGSGDTCLVLNAAAARLRQIRGEWVIVDGRHRVSGFGGKQRDAEIALAAIKQSQASQYCLAGRLVATRILARRG
jgi:hypothetical protein